jgi:hypothetical protein
VARDGDPLIRYAERPSRRRLAEVVRAYQEFVWKIALRVSGNREDAADIAQDVFLKLLLEPPVPAAIRSSGAYLAWRVIGRDEPDCADAADADDNGTLEITDTVYLFGFLFLGGDPPPAPGPSDCGEDGNSDKLDCASASCM